MEHVVEGEEVIVTASATHPAGIERIRLYYGSGLKGNFTFNSMNDDGTTPDASAGDGIFTGFIPSFPAGTFVRYYLEATALDDSLTVSYIPEGAEYDVFVYQVEAGISDVDGLVINEFLASNDQAQADNHGEFDDWVEIHNLSGEAISLEGFHLTDELSEPAKWTFPDVKVEPGGYLVVWADDDEEQGPLHAGFKISASGEELILSDSLGNRIDQVTFPMQEPDISFGRWPNGTGDFHPMSPTFNAYNGWPLSGDTGIPEERVFGVYPNPCRDVLHITTVEAVPGDIVIIAASGQVVHRQPFAPSVRVSRLPAGIYILRCGTESILISKQ